ncbi:MAG TPA: alpha/beta fold hydrolase [Macromonas sp.]|nr:alpha/beta fold hydrolase [Macromonas sp.]
MTLLNHELAPPHWWLPGGNAQTIWPALFGRTHLGAPPATQRTRWFTPDGDFIDVDRWLPAADPAAPVLVLFHGLEGAVSSHYAQAFATLAQRSGWGFVLPHFRGCSGECNWAPRAYHSGDHEEIGWMLGTVAREHPGRKLVACGISLGGNALLRWAEEAGSAAGQTVQAVAAVSSPVDLAAAGQAIDRGWNRQVYARMFLRTMVRKARRKWAQFPGLFDLEAVLKARTIAAFDDAFTAPLHGFAGVQDYWLRASAKAALRSVRIPALLLNARNDPFVPAWSLPQPDQVGDCVTLWQPAHGGHCGFPSVSGPLDIRGHVFAMPEAVMAWLKSAGGL